MKALIYVQHLVGVGHLRRALLLAKGMKEHGIEAVVVSGGRPVPLFQDARVHQLPPSQCTPGDFSTILDGDGRPVDDAWKQDRCARLLDCFEREQPDVLVLETFPFGRRQFRFELLPLLEQACARPRPPRIICSIRDVLQRRSEEREAETVAVLNRLFDTVWVHGDPDWITLEESFSQVAGILPEVAYTGYVAEPWSNGAAGRGDEVIVSAGGGAAGIALMRCAARASRLGNAAARPWRFLVGGDITRDETARISREAGDNAAIEPLRPDFKSLLSTCRVSISQFGYNTAVDLMQTGARAVVVPYEGRGETEQRTRAELLAARGLVEMVSESELTPAALAAAVDRAMLREPGNAPDIRLDGASRCARWLAEEAQA